MAEFNSIVFGLSCLMIAISFTYLVYRLSKSKLLQKNEPNARAQKASLAHVLPSMKGKYCEFHTRIPSALQNYELSFKGVLLDIDSEWILVSSETKKGDVERICRISQIRDAREIMR